MRCGLISQQDYLETLGKSVTNLLRSLGRMKQTVVEASWDAWIKYYRPDENAINNQMAQTGALSSRRGIRSGINHETIP